MRHKRIFDPSLSNFFFSSFQYCIISVLWDGVVRLWSSRSNALRKQTRHLNERRARFIWTPSFYFFQVFFSFSPLVNVVRRRGWLFEKIASRIRDDIEWKTHNSSSFVLCIRSSVLQGYFIFLMNHWLNKISTTLKSFVDTIFMINWRNINEILVDIVYCVDNLFSCQSNSALLLKQMSSVWYFMKAIRNVA